MTALGLTASVSPSHGAMKQVDVQWVTEIALSGS
jgi:hypothetical protein